MFYLWLLIGTTCNQVFSLVNSTSWTSRFLSQLHNSTCWTKVTIFSSTSLDLERLFMSSLHRAVGSPILLFFCQGLQLIKLWVLYGTGNLTWSVSLWCRYSFNNNCNFSSLTNSLFRLLSRDAKNFFYHGTWSNSKFIVWGKASVTVSMP